MKNILKNLTISELNYLKTLTPEIIDKEITEKQQQLNIINNIKVGDCYLYIEDDDISVFKITEIPDDTINLLNIIYGIEISVSNNDIYRGMCDYSIYNLMEEWKPCNKNIFDEFNLIYDHYQKESVELHDKFTKQITNLLQNNNL